MRRSLRRKLYRNHPQDTGKSSENKRPHQRKAKKLRRAKEKSPARKSCGNTTYKKFGSSNFKASTPQRIRTSNLRIRSPMLYPVELGVLGGTQAMLLKAPAEKSPIMPKSSPPCKWRWSRFLGQESNSRAAKLWFQLGAPSTREFKPGAPAS